MKREDGFGVQRMVCFNVREECECEESSCEYFWRLVDNSKSIVHAFLCTIVKFTVLNHSKNKRRQYRRPQAAGHAFFVDALLI